ncbi:hypothetical protein PIB30_054533 [Stylosanthes scabra]|uniref:PdxS/SNZ N-terminal domain-containing protein n=1 Tax=Stylosanthes scabra TaxID=79078 RepID=A0ABU6YHD2_9FABA|nr:hypothetical protein [Stylosanthes scabra]
MWFTLADEDNHINKHKFHIPFVCSCRNLGEALRKAPPYDKHRGRGWHRQHHQGRTFVMGLRNMDDDEVFTFSKKIVAPYHLVVAGGVAKLAYAALMMQLDATGFMYAPECSRGVTWPSRAVRRAGGPYSSQHVPNDEPKSENRVGPYFKRAKKVLTRLDSSKLAS